MMAVMNDAEGNADALKIVSLTRTLIVGDSQPGRVGPAQAPALPSLLRFSSRIASIILMFKLCLYFITRSLGARLPVGGPLGRLLGPFGVAFCPLGIPLCIFVDDDHHPDIALVLKISFLISNQFHYNYHS